MKNLKHIKMFESFKSDEVENEVTILENDMEHDGEFTIEKSSKLNRYKEEIITYTITLSKPLNLGNNFRYDHFVEALRESEEGIDVRNVVSNMESDCLVVIKARGNYGRVSNYWVVDEFPFGDESDWLNGTENFDGY